MTLNNSMSITPMPPAKAKGARFEHGSVLGGKTRATRVNSQWKSTVRGLPHAVGCLSQCCFVHRSLIRAENRFGRLEASMPVLGQGRYGAKSSYFRMGFHSVWAREGRSPKPSA